MIETDIIGTVSIQTDTIAVSSISTECRLEEGPMKRIITTEIPDLATVVSQEMVSRRFSST